MAIKVFCESCNKLYSVRGDMAGKRGKCPQGHLIVVPLIERHASIGNSPTDAHAGESIATPDTVAMPRLRAIDMHVQVPQESESVVVDAIVVSECTPGVSPNTDSIAQQITQLTLLAQGVLMVTAIIGIAGICLQALMWSFSPTLCPPELVWYSSKYAFHETPVPKGYVTLATALSLLHIFGVGCGFYGLSITRRLRRRLAVANRPAGQVRNRALVIWLISCCCSLCVLGLTFVRDAAIAVRARDTRNHLREIVSAIDQFEQHNKIFPSHASAGADGAALLSWRVQILPHLGEKVLYDKFRLDEPWDGPPALCG